MFNPNPATSTQPVPQHMPHGPSQSSFLSSANYNKISLSIPALTYMPRIATGQLSSDNSYKHAKLNFISQEDLKKGLMSTVDRSNQLEKYSNYLTKQTQKVQNSLAQLKGIFTNKIDKFKETSLSVGRIQFLLLKASDQLKEYDRVTNEFFSIFHSSYTNNRLPKVVSPSVFVIDKVNALSADVEDLLDRIKQAEIASQATEDCLSIQVLQSLWQYMLAVAGKCFQFRQRYESYRKHIIAQRGRNYSQVNMQFQDRKKQAIRNKFYILETLDKAQNTLSQMDMQQTSLK